LISFTDYKFLEIYDRDLKVLLLLGFSYRLVFFKIDLRFLLICFIFSMIFLMVRFVSKGGLGDGDLFFYLGLFCFLEIDLILNLVRCFFRYYKSHWSKVAKRSHSLLSSYFSCLFLNFSF